jgi:hypothetical protein
MNTDGTIAEDDEDVEVRYVVGDDKTARVHSQADARGVLRICGAEKREMIREIDVFLIRIRRRNRSAAGRIRTAQEEMMYAIRKG